MNGLQALDAIVIVVLLVSGVFAFMRGFVHELLALGGWVGAGFAALYGLPFLRPLTRGWISVSWAADILAGALLFIGALVVFSLVTHAISRRVQDSQLGFLDRTLGFGFGLLRGGLILCLAWLVLGWLMTVDEQPSWIREAKTRSLLEQGSAILVSLAPSQLGAAEKSAKEAQAKAEELEQGRQALEQLTRPGPNQKSNNAGGGYDAKDRGDMDKLMNSQR